MSGIGGISALALVVVITVAAPSAAQSGSADDTKPRRYYVEGSVFGQLCCPGDVPGREDYLTFVRTLGGALATGEFVSPRFAYKLELARSARVHRQYVSDGTHVETTYQLSSFAALVGYQPASRGRMRLTLLAGFGSVWKQETDTATHIHPLTMTVTGSHYTGGRTMATMVLGADVPVSLGWGLSIVPQVRFGGLMHLGIAGRWSFGTLPRHRNR